MVDRYNIKRDRNISFAVDEIEEETDGEQETHSGLFSKSLEEIKKEDSRKEEKRGNKEGQTIERWTN